MPWAEDIPLRPGDRLCSVTLPRYSRNGLERQASLGSGRARARSARGLVDGERDDFRLAAIAGASWAEGLAALMLGERGEATALLRRAADEYVESWAASPTCELGPADRGHALPADGPRRRGLERDAKATLARGPRRGRARSRPMPRRWRSSRTAATARRCPWHAGCRDGRTSSVGCRRPHGTRRR